MLFTPDFIKNDISHHTIQSFKYNQYKYSLISLEFAHDELDLFDLSFCHLAHHFPQLFDLLFSIRTIPSLGQLSLHLTQHFAQLGNAFFSFFFLVSLMSELFFYFLKGRGELFVLLVELFVLLVLQL